MGDHDAALADQLLAMADDELLLGHRDSEWTGHAPILEEDIAFANLAQDELGHAIAWYRLVESLSGDQPDHLVFFREPSAYRNVQLVEIANGDWAFSMLRHFLFDAAEATRLPLLAASAWPPLAAAAAKIASEERYHLRHTRAWVQRLAQGTPESHRRMQQALDLAWPYAGQLFTPLPAEAELTAAGIVPDGGQVARAWAGAVEPFLEEIGLAVPGASENPIPRRDEHTEQLTELLLDMQSVARSEGSGVAW